MKLYLVQHAEAKQEDPDRPLSDKGQADIRKVAAYVAANTSPQVSRIIHSGKTRARQTAEILAEVLSPFEGIGTSPDLAPLAAPSIWAGQLTDTESDMMLVGHLPHMSKLAALLITQNQAQTVVNFQMGGVVCLARDEAGAWAVQWMVTPDIVNHEFHE